MISDALTEAANRLEQVNTFRENDYDGAIALCQLLNQKVAQAFQEQLAALDRAKEKINHARENNGERPMNPESILEKDIKVLTRGEGTEKYWQERCLSVASKFQQFIGFMKEYQPKAKDANFVNKLSVHYPVFKEFDELYTLFITCRDKANAEIQKHPLVTMIMSYKASGFPVNETVYTQTVAELISLNILFTNLTTPMYDMCTLVNLAQEAYGWLHKSAN